MAQKPGYETFSSSWNKTLNWAHQQGIGTASVLPVYELDAKRFVSGTYPMSEAERTRAILASYNPNNVTPLPTDQPQGGIGGFFHNIMHDATNIFTGLQPTHLVTSIFDSVKNTVEHPNWLFDPKKNTLAQLIPGVSLIGEYEQGGIDNVMAHPLITFLNMLGIASAGTGLIARTALGETLAASIGVGSKEALAQMGPVKIATRYFGSRLPSKTMGLSRDPVTGLPTYGRLTASKALTNWANIRGVGTQIADLNALVHHGGTEVDAKLQGLIADGTVANAKMADKTLTVSDEQMARLTGLAQGSKVDYVHAAFNMAVFSGKSWEELRAIPSVPVEIKEATKHYERAERWIEEKGLGTGKLTKVHLPDGTFGVFTAAEAPVLTAAAKKADDASARVEEVAQKPEQIGEQIRRNDAANQVGLRVLSDNGGQVQAFLGRPLSSDIRTSLLPTGREDRAWHELGMDPERVAALLSVPKATITQGRLVYRIFGSGGLLAQVAEAYQREDFAAFRDLTAKLDRALNSKTILGARGGAEQRMTMTELRLATKKLGAYAKERKIAEDAFARATADRRLKPAIKALNSAERAYERAVWNHPAATWQPLLVKLTNDKIAEDERSVVLLEQALSDMKDTRGVTDKALAEYRSDPGRLVDLLRTYIKAGHEAPFGVSLDKGIIAEMENSAKNEIESLRAQGHVPHYVPSFSSRDATGAYEPGVLKPITLNPTHYMTPDQLRQRMMDQANTMYDIWGAQTHAMAQQLQSDANADLIDNIIIPKHGYMQSELMAMIQRDDPLMRSMDAATHTAYLRNLLENVYDLEEFNPAAYGVASSRHLKGADTVWIPKGIAKGLRDITAGPSELAKTIAVPTDIFRNSVLGYSPRFVAHIGFGGTFLVALREPTSFLKIPEAMRMLKDPKYRAEIHTRSTQMGKDDPVSLAARAFHEHTGATGGRWMAQEMMDTLGLPPDKISSWFRVVPQITFKLTNLITDLQRSSVALTGEARAFRKGYVLDDAGHKVEVTPERARAEGVRIANKVMGDLSHMTPLEQNILTSVVPFYGWTKHVLTYVATYPVDHPYRAVFLAYLANMNSDSVSKGLYTRIQNLLFLGSPDQFGNVKAIDVRALNPLRDVANYATLGGLISMLNPVISAPFSMVDPEIVFGSNVLYPNVTYNQLYGTRTAAPAGNLLTGVEQFVPEVGALDAALGLSAQYRNLAKTNPNSFAKQIFGALNIPFAQVQNLNVKQIAARQEIDRYQVAKTAAEQAWQTGNFGALAGYTSVPDPLQADYNVSPAQIEAMYQASLAAAPGIPPSEYLPPLPTPPGL